MGRLEGKVALITGAARGQGAAHARAFVSEGARVVLTDVLEEEGRALCESLGDEAFFVALDVTDEIAWKDAVGSARERFGGLDVLVNNAGISMPAPILETSVADFDRHYRINQLGTFLGIKTCGRSMIVAGSGSIVNVASVAALMAVEGSVAYIASKAAVRGISRAAAVELGPQGVRVNTIFPGVVETPMIAYMPAEVAEVRKAMIPLGRLAASDEGTPLVVYLASDESAYVTGAEIVFDGGVTAALWPGNRALVPRR